MKGLIIWGCGGHARVIFDVAIAMSAFDAIAYYDDNPAAGTPSLAELRSRGFGEFIVAIGDNSARAQCFEEGQRVGLRPATCIHPAAWISPSASVGAGTVVMARSVIQSNARIGRNCIVNTGAIVEHDCTIGDHTHLSPSVTLGGAVAVGERVHLGIGVVAIPLTRIGDRTTVGAGAVVIREVPCGVKAVGVPARVIGDA